MQPPARLALSAAFGLAVVLTAGSLGRAESGPPELTSDTAAYCEHLSSQVARKSLDAPPPARVTQLSSDGQKLCASGQLRRGIDRLRRALMIMDASTGR